MQMTDDSARAVKLNPWGLGFRVTPWGLGFRVTPWGLGFRVTPWGLGFRGVKPWTPGSV